MALLGFLPENTPWLQWTGCWASTILNFVIGLMLGWTSPYLTQLTAQNSPLPITMDEGSWLVSMTTMSRLFGGILGAASVQYFGSKRTLLFLGFPKLFCWILIIFADSIEWLYGARLLSGISLGGASSSMSIYLGEVSNPDIRGGFISLAMTGFPMGILAGTIMGTYLTMTLFAWISLIPTIAAILLFVWMPESPHHLMHVGKIEEAQKSMLRYYPGANLVVEMKALKNFVTTTHSLSFTNRLRKFKDPQNKKCGLIIAVLFIFVASCGINSIIFYLEIILTKGKVTMIAPATMVIILTSVGILAGICALICADKFARRTLWIAVCSGACVSLVMMGVHFVLLDHDFNPNKMQWLLICSLIFWEICVYLGICNVPTIFLGELFAPDIKTMAAFLASFFNAIFSFVSSKSYQPMVNAMGEANVFWVHAGILALATVVGFTFLPETRGKTLREIQESLVSK